MPSWSELERRFEELEPGLNGARLDHQTGTDGESWRLAASFNAVSSTRFESLSTIAGQKLLSDLGLDGLPQEVRDAPDDRHRWYSWLARNYRFYKPGSVGHHMDEDGNPVGWIATGTIYQPGAVSAAHCLELMSMVNEDEKSSAPPSITVTGPGARVNWNSVDNSTNSITSNQSTVFDDARKCIINRVSGDDRIKLLERLEELQAAPNASAYTARYKEFVATAADHVSVLGPVVSALTALLG